MPAATDIGESRTGEKIVVLSRNQGGGGICIRDEKCRPSQGGKSLRIEDKCCGKTSSLGKGAIALVAEKGFSSGGGINP